MAMVVPHEGEVQLLSDLLAGGSLENWTLKLFKSNTTPALTDTSATYTESTFTGYSSKTLTRTSGSSTWNTVGTTGSVLESGCAKSSYGSAAQSWSCTSAETCYGYFAVGATSGKVVMAERFASLISLVNPSTLTLQPTLELAT
jgi:hypothetical protein